jgi:hypothetical protein
MPNLCGCKVTIRSQDFDTILAVAQVAKKHGPLSPHKVPLGASVSSSCWQKWASVPSIGRYQVRFCSTF